MSITEETRREGHEAIDKAKRQAMILGCLHGRKMTARQIAYELFRSERGKTKAHRTAQGGQGKGGGQTERPAHGRFRGGV